MSRHTNRRAHARLDALYAQLPTIACRGLCAAACGPIPATIVEAARLQAADPQRRRLTVTADATCGYLTAGARCRVYAARPLMCRAFGLAKRLSCPHGCVPDRWLTDHDFVAFAQAVERIGGAVVVSGPDGPIRTGETYRDIDVSRLDPADADRLAEHTRHLRALHGGRIVGVVPSAANGVVHLDDLRRHLHENRTARGPALDPARPDRD